MLKELRGKLILLAFLFILSGLVSFLSGWRLPVPIFSPAKPAPTLGENIRNGTASIPTYSTSTKEKLAKSHGFQALISYTDQGFEPNEATIKKGDTVRFTNNASRDVWIASQGGEVQIYPRTKDGCGTSDLDSCLPFSPQDFWEFTFDTAGDWHVVNNLDKAKSGVVHVK